MSAAAPTESAAPSVLMLSWEFPPVLVGGLGRHVHALAGALARSGCEVTVAARAEDPSAPADETVDCDGAAVRVVRAVPDPPAVPFDHDNLLAWSLAFNHALVRAALYASRTQDFTVVHAHDWLSAHAAVTLKRHLDVPLAATVHSTEAGRHRGWLPDAVARSIHAVEWWLTYEARRVIVCSQHMRWEVDRLFELPPDKTAVVPNGVDAERFAVSPRRRRRVRAELGAAPVLLYAGRLVHEKGVQDLLAAAALLRRRFPDLRVLIAGEGGYEPELRRLSSELGLEAAVDFLGFTPAERLKELMAAVDCVVAPSRYEPFGLVALEAAAAGAAVAASDVGGLAEVVEADRTGVLFPPAAPERLAEALQKVLSDPERAERLRVAAAQSARRRFGWDQTAAGAVAVYRAAETAERDVEAQLAAAELELRIPEGNLLD